jgi:hypothetical protein
MRSYVRRSSYFKREDFMKVMSNGKIRRTRDEWRAILSRWERSGLSLREFCHKQEIQLSSFQRWQEKLTGASDGDAFVALTPAPPTVSSWSLEVTLPNGSKLHFQG